MHKLLIFHNQQLLIQALTHRSYVNGEDNKDNKHDERLEFLSEIVLPVITILDMEEIL